MNRTRKFKCFSCGYEWEVAFGIPRPGTCPKCKSTNIHRINEETGTMGHHGHGRGRYMR